MKLDLRSDGQVERWLQEISILDYDAENSSKYVLGMTVNIRWVKINNNLRKTGSEFGRRFELAQNRRQ